MVTVVTFITPLFPLLPFYLSLEAGPLLSLPPIRVQKTGRHSVRRSEGHLFEKHSLFPPPLCYKRVGGMCDACRDFRWRAKGVATAMRVVATFEFLLELPPSKKLERLLGGHTNKFVPLL